MKAKKERHFDGVFAEHIDGFIRQKRALGYDYSEGAYILSRFEDFCKKHFPDSTVLDREIGLKWAERLEKENGSCQLNRICVLRGFGKYLNSIGVPAYVIPPNLNKKSPPPKPYVFSNEELSMIFRAADEYPYKKLSPVFHLIVSVIFRLIYCCGLRPAEARQLRVEDVDLKTGQIKILEAKKHRDRMVVMSDDMLELARRYNEHVSLKYPDRVYFFHNRSNDGMYSRVHMQKNFRVLLDMAGIEKKNAKNPRIYDLRHTFATHKLYCWLQEGEDIEACVAYLSEYMGHTHIADTAYYIHFVPEFYPQMKKLGFETSKSILPEVPT